MRLCGLLAGYERMKFECRHYREARGTSYGIAVNNDHYAKEFQKCDRKRRKCFDLLAAKLYRIDKGRRKNEPKPKR